MEQAATSRRISRLEAFADQGVTLAYPSRSWSGVRRQDGAVVIAIREGEVQSFVDGFRCLLWSPVIEGATEWVDRPIKDERRGHCRLALLLGGAAGLLVSGGTGEVERGSVLTLRVEKRAAEYWALWGSVVSASGVAAMVRGPAYAPFVEAARMAA